jgi:hypothetical protein
MLKPCEILVSAATMQKSCPATATTYENLVNILSLTNSGTLIVNVGVEATGVLHITTLLSLSGMMRLLNHVLGAHDLPVFKDLLENVDISVVFQIHYFSICN